MEHQELEQLREALAELDRELARVDRRLRSARAVVHDVHARIEALLQRFSPPRRSAGAERRPPE